MSLVKLNLFEKSVIFAHALTDGLATTALLSACYWYTITPVAPACLGDLCHDPMSFKAIAILSIIATLTALPITYIRYQQLNKDTIKICRALFKESLIYRKIYKRSFPQVPTSRVFARDAARFNSQVLVTTFMSALTITGVTLSTAWTYASLIIGANLITTVSFSTWEHFALACIIFGSMLGCAIGAIKHKNLYREELTKQMHHANRRVKLATYAPTSRRITHYTLNKVIYR